jgi:hypothetical protein
MFGYFFDFFPFLSSFLSSDMGPESLFFIFLIFAGYVFLSGISSFDLDLELEERKAFVSVFFFFYGRIPLVFILVVCTGFLVTMSLCPSPSR